MLPVWQGDGQERSGDIDGVDGPLPRGDVQLANAFPFSEATRTLGGLCMLNRRFFFDHVRLALFGGSLKKTQVAGLSAILDEWEANHAAQDDRWLAYMLATTFHETAMTIQPIARYGTTAYFTRMYDPLGANPALARRLGNTEPGDGPRFCGRGFVQLTGRAN